MAKKRQRGQESQKKPRHLGPLDDFWQERLCCPPNSTKKLLGKTFILRQAVPVDLFPHTLHCELELLFTP
ncbi:hypothetical protein G4228_019068 [Cervus hanglu yarkandensis]|nr:hypothetical protein G4228_019068 [Cervus hanglu yarkandensis]